MAGRADVEAFLDELSIPQVRKWRAYFDVIGTEAWLRAGTVAAEVDALASAMCGKGSKVKPEDKIPHLLREEDLRGNDGGIASLEKALTLATQGP